jgi:hypothetical protein
MVGSGCLGRSIGKGAKPLYCFLQNTYSPGRTRITSSFTRSVQVEQKAFRTRIRDLFCAWGRANIVPRSNPRGTGFPAQANTRYRVHHWTDETVVDKGIHLPLLERTGQSQSIGRIEPKRENNRENIIAKHRPWKGRTHAFLVCVWSFEGVCLFVIGSLPSRPQTMLVWIEDILDFPLPSWSRKGRSLSWTGCHEHNHDSINK